MAKTVTEVESPPAPPAPSGRGFVRADGATLAMVFAVVLLVIPARLVFVGLPLSISPANLVALISAAVWLFAHFTVTLNMAKGRTPVRTGIFAYATSMIATFGFATYGFLPADELGLADHAFILIIANVGLALLVCDGIRSPERLDFLLKCVVLAGAFISVIGAFQYLFNIDLTNFLELPGLRYTSEDATIIERGGGRRVGSTTGHPIEFGVVCSMLLPIAVHYGYKARLRGEPALRWWGCAGLIGLGLMFSVSRSAVLGLAAVSLVLLIGWPSRRRLQALLVTLGFLVVIRVAVPGLLGTFYSLFANFGNDDSIRYRTHDYDVAVAEISRHPWLGRGVGTWYAPKHQVFDNQYILSTVETGYIGIVAFAMMFLIAIYAGLRVRYLSPDPGTRDLGLTLSACLVAPLVGSATFDLLSFATVTGLAYLLIGANGALLRTTEAGLQGPAQASGPTVPVTR
ncbi:O-antigen ligase family protein [Spongiactinospora sp. TRM90649]|uniref:O-antigen ligase family protein n=1 Tax=Spongiactinospora sp. TRM90649 TaxID=3031114 RepID=UPI0023F8EB00|nr:O-antigen ligase family protein [Spongiactinospora sp. TRM90649]MDF5755016.1 O-antigen ligase family protein [Spongiactinospora sp. TRM90649]